MTTQVAKPEALVIRKFARQHGVMLSYADCVALWQKVQDLELCKEVILSKPSWAWW